MKATYPGKYYAFTEGGCHNYPNGSGTFKGNWYHEYFNPWIWYSVPCRYPDIRMLCLWNQRPAASDGSTLDIEECAHSKAQYQHLQRDYNMYHLNGYQTSGGKLVPYDSGY
jgi:hypothetical protein